MRYLAVTLVLVCGAVAVQAQNQQHFYSIKKENALGAQLASQVRRQTTSLGLVDVDKYVQTLGHRLAEQMPNAGGDWQFSVIRDRSGGSTGEPISLPGGYVFIPAQLILAAESDAEFAGMLAHAMAHIVERHGIRQADQFAVSAIARTGYDPRALLNYIRRIQSQLSANESRSPLPRLSLRISNLEQAIQNLPGSSSPASSEFFRSIQQEEVRGKLAQTSGQGEVPSLIHPKR